MSIEENPYPEIPKNLRHMPFLIEQEAIKDSRKIFSPIVYVEGDFYYVSSRKGSDYGRRLYRAVLGKDCHSNITNQLQSVPHIILFLCEEYSVYIDNTTRLGLNKPHTLDNLGDLEEVDCGCSNLGKTISHWSEGEDNIDDIKTQFSQVECYSRGLYDIQVDLEKYIQELEDTVEELQSIIINTYNDEEDDIIPVKYIWKGLSAARGRRDKRIKEFKEVNLC